MSLPSIAMINFSTQLDDREVQRAIRAVNRQVVEDFAPIWGSGRICRLHEAAFNPADIDTLSMQPVNADGVIYLVDQGLLPGALGFHDLNARDLPFGFVFILNPNDWTVTLSHEVLELILDPTVNIFVPGPDPRTGTGVVLHTYEVCDAVERTAYEIDGVLVSNFLTPSYFTIGDAAGTRNDFLGVDVPSFGVTQGSHIAFFDLAADQFEQVIGQQAIPEACHKRYIPHVKADRPTDEDLDKVLYGYRAKPARGAIQPIAPTGLQAVSSISRTGRYSAAADRMGKTRAAGAGASQ